MKDQIYPGPWMHQSREIRARLAEVFNLTKTGVSEIRDQEVISDGYTVEDLRGITLEKMCDYVGSTETFYRAWELSISKAKFELSNPVEMKITEAPDLAVEENPVKVVEEPVVVVVEEAIVAEEPVVAEEEEDTRKPLGVYVPPTFTDALEAPWCDTCDSKGVRHKKECDKYVAI